LDLNYGVLFFFVISSLSIYGIVFSGWVSNSRFAFLGSLRAIAQVISYEISFGLVLIPVIVCSGTLNLTALVYTQKNV